MKTKLLAIAVGLISMVVTACNKNESTVDVNETIPSSQKNKEDIPSAQENIEEPPPEDQKDAVTVEDYAIGSEEIDANDISVVFGVKYGAQTPHLKLLKPSVTGAIETRIIQKIARQHFGELRACYERELSKNKNLNGNLIVTLEVTPQGAADKVTIKESELNMVVDDCVSNSIKRWHFPAPEDGGTTQIEYPFLFSRP